MSKIAVRFALVVSFLLFAGACGSLPGQLSFGSGAVEQECDAMTSMLLDPIHATTKDRAIELVGALDDTLGDADDRYLNFSTDGPNVDPEDPFAEARETTDVLNEVNQRSFEACGVPVLAALAHVEMTNQVCDSSFDCDELPHMANDLPCFSASATTIDLGSLDADGFAIASYAPIDCETKEMVELRADGTWVTLTAFDQAMSMRQALQVTAPIPAGTEADEAFRHGWVVWAFVPEEDFDVSFVISRHQTAGFVAAVDLAVGHLVAAGDFVAP